MKSATEWQQGLYEEYAGDLFVTLDYFKSIQADTINACIEIVEVVSKGGSSEEALSHLKQLRDSLK